MEKKILTIDRSKWNRGKKGPGACLMLNEVGMMCCLGFDALACGLTESQIMGVGTPSMIMDAPEEYISKRSTFKEVCMNSPVGDAIRANDNELMLDSDREIRVREALIGLGWDDVVFVDGQP